MFWYIQAQQVQLLSQRSAESQDQHVPSQYVPFGQYLTDLSGSRSDLQNY